MLSEPYSLTSVHGLYTQKRIRKEATTFVFLTEKWESKIIYKNQLLLLLSIKGIKFGCKKELDFSIFKENDEMLVF